VDERKIHPKLHQSRAVTQQALGETQSRSAEIIEALGFGVVQGLAIRNGQPCFDPPPRIVQSIKLGSHPQSLRHSGDNETLKKAFADLFHHLSALKDCTVDIEVQHGLPFRLILERSAEEFE
jgi:hypothetical protein